MDTYLIVFVIAGVIFVLIYPLVFCSKFKKNYGILPISIGGLVLQLVSIIALFIQDTDRNFTLPIIIIIACFAIALFIDYRKMVGLGVGGKDLFLSLYSQFFCPVYIILVFLIINAANSGGGHANGAIPQGGWYTDSDGNRRIR